MTSAECTSRLDIPIFQISFCLLPLHACARHIPKPRFNPKVLRSIHLHSLSLSLSFLCSVPVCQSLTVLNWRARCTASYDPDVTTNPSSTHDMAAPKTSSGQTQTKTRTHTHTETTHCCRASADSADPGGKCSYVVWAFLSPTSPTASDSKRRKGIASLHLQARATP